MIQRHEVLVITRVSTRVRAGYQFNVATGRIRVWGSERGHVARHIWGNYANSAGDDVLWSLKNYIFSFGLFGGWKEADLGVIGGHLCSEFPYIYAHNSEFQLQLSTNISRRLEAIGDLPDGFGEWRPLLGCTHES